MAKSKIFEIVGYSDRKFYAKVKATNEEDALKFAKKGQFYDEETEEENFLTDEFEVMQEI